jgi:hypothetical protein
MKKNQFLNGSMPRGVRIPNVEGGTLGTRPCSTEDGLLRYRAAWERLRREPPTAPSSVLGRLTHEEGIKLNLRHAELHLGYLRERT